MVLRKPTISNASASKTNTPGEQLECNIEREMRPPRVALRSGSPRAPIRVTLHSAPMKGPRVTMSPPKVGLSPGSNIRARPAVPVSAKVPWISPTTKIPTFNQRKVCAGRTTLSGVVKETPRSPPRGSVTRYPIRSLLALRPSPDPEDQIRKVSAYKKHCRDERLESTFRVLEAETVTVSKNKDLLCYVSARSAKKPAQKEEELEWTIRSPLGYRSRSPMPETPTKEPTSSRNQINDIAPESDSLRSSQGSPLTYRGWYRTIETQTKEPVISKGQVDDQAAKVEDLESRIRSALSNRGRRRHFETPRKVRSVKWDPAILACGTVVSSQPFAENGPAPTTEAPQVPFNIQLKFEKDDRPTQATLPHERVRLKLKRKVKVHEYMKTITELKKGDRRKLLQLLEALRNIDSDDSSDTDTGNLKAHQKLRSAEIINSGKKLNPKAVAFGDFSPLKTAAPPGYPDTYREPPSLNVPRKRPHLYNENHNPCEPVWCKTGDRLPEAKREGLYDPQSEETQRMWADRFKSMPIHGPHVPRAPRAHYFPLIPYIPQVPHIPQVHHVVQAPFSPHIPQVSQAHNIPYVPQVSRAQQQTRVNPKLPIINLATGRIPSETGTGREAKTIHPTWAKSLLEKFAAKYPLTGKLKAAPPIPIQNRHATTIQQRLEYLLLEQKEKKAREQLFEQKKASFMEQNEEEMLYQDEKEALKQLFEQLEGKDLQTKEVEEKPLTPRENKAVERISEASTCVDSAEFEESLDPVGGNV